PSTYLETSVIGAYLDNGEPFRRDLTIRWWEHELSEYRAVISPLVVSELERLSEPHRSAYLKLIKGLEQVELTEEAATVQVITTRSASSFTYRVPDIRGLKKTQMAGTVSTSVLAASCN